MTEISEITEALSRGGPGSVLNQDASGWPMARDNDLDTCHLVLYSIIDISTIELRTMSTRSAFGSRPASSIDPPWTDRLPHTINFGPNVPPVRRSQTALARRFYQMCMGIQAEALATTDLTALQFAAMAYLNRQNGEPGIDQNSLAARLGVERSHASLLVEELVTKGLIEQRVNGADRRARVLSLSPKGENLYERVLPSIRAANERVLGPLSPHERELFKDMLIRMIGANGAYARPGAGRRKRSSRQSSSGSRTPS